MCPFWHFFDNFLELFGQVRGLHLYSGFKVSSPNTHWIALCFSYLEHCFVTYKSSWLLRCSVSAEKTPPFLRQNLELFGQVRFWPGRKLPRLMTLFSHCSLTFHLWASKEPPWLTPSSWCYMHSPEDFHFFGLSDLGLILDARRHSLCSGSY